MIAFMPKIYEDELCYSWFARYYCHSGYSAYGYALDDLFGKRTIHFNAEYINSSFSDSAKEAITNMLSMEELILEHTMFPVVRFMDQARMRRAIECMTRQEGKVSDLLPLPKEKDQRFLRYCPCCTTEQRKKYGEAFWTRTANIPHIGICAKHRCKLKNTDIVLSGKQSPRLYIADLEIEDVEPEYIEDGIGLEFAQYLTAVFHEPINSNNDISISDFLKSNLEGTRYLNVTGIKRNMKLFYDDFMDFYRAISNHGITELSQMQKIFTGYRSGFYEICQIAFFLGVSAEDLTAPVIPKKSQEELFQEKVESLREAGVSYKQIARMLGADFHSVRKSEREKEQSVHDYSGRKGISKEDWDKMDAEMLPKVKEICKKVYGNEGGKPGKVTVGTITRIMGFPGKRMDYLPKCRSEIKKYEESQEIFWTRKIVWNYRKLVSEGERISYNRLCRPLNLRKENFISALPFLLDFCSEEEERIIKALV